MQEWNVAGLTPPLQPPSAVPLIGSFMRSTPSPLSGPLAEPLRTHARADTWFRLQSPADVAREVVDLSRRELELAAEGLWVSPGPALDAGILYARSAVEKVRLLLRLSRAGMPRKVRRKANRQLKKLGTRLADVRDAGTLEDVVERLRQGTREPALRDGLMVLGGRLAERRYRQGAAMRNGSPLLEIREGLEGLHARAVEWPLEGDGFDLLAPGLVRVHRRGRQALEKVQKRATPKRERRLMRRLRDVGYTLRLMEPLWPAPVGALEHEVDRAACRLHEAGELGHLVSLLTDDETMAANLPVAELVELMERLRARFQHEALVTAERILAEEPDAARDRLGVWWAVWAREGAGSTEN